MRIELIVPDRVAAGSEFTARALLINDGYEPAEVLRNVFVGPTATPAGTGPVPAAVEPTFGQAEQPLLLQPFTFYGRDRQAGGFPPGVVTVTATYQVDGAAPLAASQEVVID
jgi:hypothetical protein